MVDQSDQTEPQDLVRILIADDHAVVRAGLRALLNAEPDLQVVGEATGGLEALRLAGELQPDVVLLDLGLPDRSGIEITQQLRTTLPTIQVLILSVHENERLLKGAIQAGAAGYVTKRAIEPELINAIHTVRRGDLYVHPAMAQVLLDELKLTAAKSAQPETEPLTPRETEVLRLIAKGHTNREAADVLGISVRTVESHRANIMGKLNVRGRVALVRYAMEHGLLDPHRTPQSLRIPDP